MWFSCVQIPMEVFVVAKKVRKAFTIIGGLMEPHDCRLSADELVAMSVQCMPSTVGTCFLCFVSVTTPLDNHIHTCCSANWGIFVRVLSPDMQWVRHLPRGSSMYTTIPRCSSTTRETGKMDESFVWQVRWVASVPCGLCWFQWSQADVLHDFCQSVLWIVPVWH